MKTVAWIITALLVLNGSALAQQAPRSDSLPRELVLALLGGTMGGRGVDVIAGLGDEGLPAELFADALVLGYGSYPQMKTTVAYFPYAPQATLDTIRSRLVRLGWKLAPRPETTERGFVSGFAGSFLDALCTDHSVVVPSVSIRTLNRTLAVISNQASQGPTDPRCNPPSAMRMGLRDQLAESPVPALYPPPGMRGSGAGSSGTVDRGLDMNTNLVGGLPVTDVHRHYADLFLAAGWRKLEEAIATSVAITAFETTDAKGQRWHVALTTSAPVGTDGVDLHLTIRQP